MSFDIETKRKEKRLTLEELAKMVGVSKSTVKKWETGYISNMRRDRINALAKILDLNPNVLIDEAPDDTPAPAPADFSSAQNEEQQLIELYRQLNPEGQEKVTDYADDLVNSGKYKKSADTVGNIA